MLATLPPIIPGGKLDPSMTPISLGVTRELEPHYRKLKDEEEKVRDELHAKQERLRKSLYTWNRLERDSRAWEMRSDLSEKSMKNLAGEGMGGAAF
jgi:vacuolar-type H+-ATPase subunit I/STV1